MSKARQIVLSRMSGFSYLLIVMMKRADLERGFAARF